MQESHSLNAASVRWRLQRGAVWPLSGRVRKAEGVSPEDVAGGCLVREEDLLSEAGTGKGSVKGKAVWLVDS